MDTVARFIAVADLRRVHGSRLGPLIIDVRRKAAFDPATHLVSGAIWRDPFAVETWAHFVPRHRDVVVYCVHGHEISKNTASALAATGLRVSFLEGGIEAWKQAGGPLTKKLLMPLIPSPINQPSIWVTRERPKIDRVACPWLIRRFIDPLAEFAYVPADQVLDYASQHNAIPYDIPGVQFTHRGDKCSFDALITDFELNDGPLNRLAAIVRGADCGIPALTPQSSGLLALSVGLSALHADDHTMLDKGIDLYDALYAWAGHAADEMHHAALFGGAGAK